MTTRTLTMTRNLKFFSEAVATDVAEAIGMPIKILQNFVEKVSRHHKNEEYGIYSLSLPDTANVSFITVTVTDTQELEVKITAKA